MMKEFKEGEVGDSIQTFKKKLVFNSLPDISVPPENNVIVLFVEGFSSRWSEFYGGKYSGLMPHFDELAKSSVAFENYFNHTAATFRGLRGQLLSGYQQLGGIHRQNIGLGQTGVTSYFRPKELVTLPSVFKDAGYATYFFLSQQNKLNEMLETLDFDSVYGRDILLASELESGAEAGLVLSDRQLFSAVISSLTKKKLKGEKFFAAVYNFDTHAGLDGDEAYAGGGNEVLNRFHTFDKNLGVFVHDFISSPLFENTTLIVTTDHSTFPDVDARRADAEIPAIFADKVPFLIFFDGVKPALKDAQNQTTVAFAPTVMHVMGFNNRDVTFFGCSLLIGCDENYYGSIGNEYYETLTGRPVSMGMKNHSIEIDSMLNLISKNKIMNGFYQVGN